MQRFALAFSARTDRLALPLSRSQPALAAAQRDTGGGVPSRVTCPENRLRQKKFLCGPPPSAGHADACTIMRCLLLGFAVATATARRPSACLLLLPRRMTGIPHLGAADSYTPQCYTEVDASACIFFQQVNATQYIWNLQGLCA